MKKKTALIIIGIVMALIIMVIAMIAGLKIRNDINLVFENDLGDYRVSYKLEEIVEENAEGITKELESLFYNQYGEAFQVLEIEYQGLEIEYQGPDTIGGSLIRLKPLEHPEIKVTGFIYKYGSVKDDYGDYLKKDAIVRQVQEVVDEVYPISKVIYEAGWKFIPYSTSEDMTVSEYSRCFEKGLRVDIYVDEEAVDLDSVYRDHALLKSKLKESGIYVSDFGDISYVKKGSLPLINERLTTIPEKEEFVIIDGGIWVNNMSSSWLVYSSEGPGEFHDEMYDINDRVAKAVYPMAFDDNGSAWARRIIFVYDENYQKNYNEKFDKYLSAMKEAEFVVHPRQFNFDNLTYEIIYLEEDVYDELANNSHSKFVSQFRSGEAEGVLFYGDIKLDLEFNILESEWVEY